MAMAIALGTAGAPDSSVDSNTNPTLVTGCAVVDVYLVDTNEFGGQDLYWFVNYVTLKSDFSSSLSVTPRPR
jgi:hypothetical protein